MTKDELVGVLRKTRKGKRQLGKDYEAFPILEDTDKLVIDNESEYESVEDNFEDKSDN